MNPHPRKHTTCPPTAVLIALVTTAPSMPSPATSCFCCCCCCCCLPRTKPLPTHPQTATPLALRGTLPTRCCLTLQRSHAHHRRLRPHTRHSCPQLRSRSTAPMEAAETSNTLPTRPLPHHCPHTSHKRPLSLPARNIHPSRPSSSLVHSTHPSRHPRARCSIAHSHPQRRLDTAHPPQAQARYSRLLPSRSCTHTTLLNTP